MAKSGRTKDSPIEDGSTKQSLSNKLELNGGAATGDEGSGSYGGGTSVQVKQNGTMLFKKFESVGLSGPRDTDFMVNSSLNTTRNEGERRH